LISSSIVASKGAALANSSAAFKVAKLKGAEQLSKPDAMVERSMPLGDYDRPLPAVLQRWASFQKVL
jgi:hypothetical protein